MKRALIVAVFLVHLAHVAQCQIPVEYFEEPSKQIEPESLTWSMRLRNALLGSLPSNEVVIGYAQRCATTDESFTDSLTPLGHGVELTAYPPKAPSGNATPQKTCPPQQTLQTCQISTLRFVWERLAKVRLDVQLPATASALWGAALQYGYDMPPVLTKDNRRYLPAHLLKRVENALGAFEVVTTDNGLSLLIGDDGGARPLRDPILYARCWDAAKTSRLAGKAPQYEDPNHKTFRLASGLEKRRIVAVGDLHGDYESTLSVLRLARVVDGEGKWAGGSNTIFVQTGDILDRGPDSIQLLELFPRLVREANAVGGRVIQIMGNHEVMNLIGDWRYVSEDEKGFSNAAMRRAAFSTLGRYGNRLSRLPVVHQIGDTVFAHGGITPEWSNVNLHKINKHATDKLHEFIAAEEADKPIPLPTVFGPDGPTWYRGYAQGPEPRVCALLKSALAIMGAKRMVVGHTMQRDGGILSRCKGQFFVIDVGISRALQNYQAALEILPGGIVNAIYPYGVISMIKRKAYEGQP